MSHTGVGEVWPSLSAEERKQVNVKKGFDEGQARQREKWSTEGEKAAKTPLPDHSTKLTNPKDLVGSNKLPLHLWPTTATATGCLALLDGMLKYGRSNWREAGVRYSIYADAAIRHIQAAWEGEDVDPDSELPHEAHALACLAIIVDARAAGKLHDDRAYNGSGYRRLVDELTPHVNQLKEKHAERDPQHFTIADNCEKCGDLKQLKCENCRQPADYTVKPVPASQLPEGAAVKYAPPHGGRCDEFPAVLPGGYQVGQVRHLKRWLRPSQDFRIVEFRVPDKGDLYIADDYDVVQASFDHSRRTGAKPFVIVEPA